jgi:hypothetical protein
VIADALSFASIHAIRPFVETRSRRSEAGIGGLPGPEPVRHHLRIDWQTHPRLVGTEHLFGDNLPSPVELVVRHELARDELGEPVEQLGGQRFGRVDIVRVRDEREHAPQIPHAQCHAWRSLTEIRSFANTAETSSLRSLL